MSGTTELDLIEAIEMIQEEPGGEDRFGVFVADLLKDPEVIAGVQERIEDIGVLAELVTEQAATVERLGRQVGVLAARVAELERANIRHRLL